MTGRWREEVVGGKGDGRTDKLRMGKPHGNLVLYKLPKFIFIYVKEFKWSYRTQDIMFAPEA